MNPKIQNFTDLNAWKQSHALSLLVYKLTEEFPARETYSLTDQMRRCAVSVSSNIAEGFSRHSKKEKIQFYYVAKGSLTELQNQLFLARDIGYTDTETFDDLYGDSNTVGKLISGLIRSLS